MPSIADFSVNITEGYAGVSTFELTNQSTSDLLDAAVWEYLWDFGNGETSTEENPTFTYNSSSNGTFTILLTTNDGTDIVPDPLPDNWIPLTNTFELQVTVVSVPIIIGDPHSSPPDVMKQYGNTDASTSYNYEMQVGHREIPQPGETIYIHGNTIPGFLAFRNTDPDDTEHFSNDIVDENFIADLNGAPIEESDIGTHNVVVTMTSTLSNGEVSTNVQDFDLTFGQHPHMPLWGPDPVKTVTAGNTYNETFKAIDDDLISDNGNETLDIQAITGEIGETGIIAVPLPDWLTMTLGTTGTEEIDGKQKTTRSVTLSGTPSEADKGTTLIAIEVTDSYDLKMQKIFGLTVE